MFLFCPLKSLIGVITLGWCKSNSKNRNYVCNDLIIVTACQKKFLTPRGTLYISVLTALVFAYDDIRKRCFTSSSTTPLTHQNISQHNDEFFPHIPISVISLNSFLILKYDGALSYLHQPWTTAVG